MIEWLRDCKNCYCTCCRTCTWTPVNHQRASNSIQSPVFVLLISHFTTEWLRRVTYEGLYTTHYLLQGLVCCFLDQWMKSFPARKVTTGYYPGFMLPTRIRVNSGLALCPALTRLLGIVLASLRKGASKELGFLNSFCLFVINTTCFPSWLGKSQVLSCLWLLLLPLARIKEDGNTCLRWGVLPDFVKVVVLPTQCILTLLWFKVCTTTVVCTSGNTSGLLLVEVSYLCHFWLLCWLRLLLKLL